MADKETLQVYELIQSELEVEPIDQNSGEDLEELRHAILGRVAYLLDRDPNLLFSYLYRLDIDERKLNKAIIGGGTQAVERIADLIFQRQLQRVRTKQKYKQDPIEGWNW